MLRRVVQEEVGQAPSHKVKCVTNFETITISLGTPYVVFTWEMIWIFMRCLHAIKLLY